MASWERWAVAAACCWVNVFFSATFRTASIIFLGIQQMFNVTREEASWPLTLVAASSSVFAPFVGCLARYVTTWKIIFAGSILNFLSITACFFANDITHLVVFLGFFHGIGTALMLLCPTVINEQFRSNKAAASGIASAGIAIAGLIFPPMTQFLFDTYGARGAFLVYGAILLNAAAGTLVLRLPAKVAKLPLQRAPEKPSASFNDTHCQTQDTGTGPTLAVEKNLNKKLHTCDVLTGQCDLIPRNDLIRQERRNDSVHISAVQRIKPENNVLGAEDCQLSPFIAREKMPLRNGSSSRMLNKVCPQRFILSFLKVPTFYLITLSFMEVIFSMSTFFTVVVDFATDRNIPRWSAVLLVTYCTATDMMGRLLSGWITDKGLLKKSTMMAIHRLMAAACLCIMPLSSSYGVYVLLSLVLGWCNGATMPLIPVLFMELVDRNAFSVCFGMATLLVGIPALARPLLIGCFRDDLGDYQGLLLLMGACAAFISFPWFIVSLKETFNCFRLFKTSVQHQCKTRDKK